MNIVVLVKQVPDPEVVIGIKDEGKSLEIEQKFTTNFFDEFAIEEALRLREKHGGKVRVITLGGDKAAEVLRKCVAMGADEVLLLADAAYLNGDGYATALALSKATARGPFDIILCGKQAVDDDRAEVGPMVAQFLGIPHAGGIVKLDVVDGKATADFMSDGGQETVEIPLPALFSAQKGLNEPRVPLVTNVMKAMKATIPRITPQELGVSTDEIGVSGSKVRADRYRLPMKRRKVQLIAGEAPQAAAEAVRILFEVERAL
jgi:electron transfer flavoprotein beta subunit